MHTLVSAIIPLLQAARKWPAYRVASGNRYRHAMDRHSTSALGPNSWTKEKKNKTKEGKEGREEFTVLSIVPGAVLFFLVPFLPPFHYPFLPCLTFSFLSLSLFLSPSSPTFPPFWVQFFFLSFLQQPLYGSRMKLGNFNSGTTRISVSCTVTKALQPSSHPCKTC